MTCLGWLCFLAPKYDLCKLWQSILQHTGVKVALHFQTIQNDWLDKAASLAPCIKAIHIDVNQAKSPQNCQSIHTAFSSKVEKFWWASKFDLCKSYAPLPTPPPDKKSWIFRHYRTNFLQNWKHAFFRGTQPTRRAKYMRSFKSSCWPTPVWPTVILCSKPNSYKRWLYYPILTSAPVQGAKNHSKTPR